MCLGSCHLHGQPRRNSWPQRSSAPAIAAIWEETSEWKMALPLLICSPALGEKKNNMVWVVATEMKKDNRFEMFLRSRISRIS